jgi:hypothetical protein
MHLVLGNSDFPTAYSYLYCYLLSFCSSVQLPENRVCLQYAAVRFASAQTPVLETTPPVAALYGKSKGDSTVIGFQITPGELAPGQIQWLSAIIILGGFLQLAERVWKLINTILNDCQRRRRKVQAKTC